MKKYRIKDPIYRAHLSLFIGDRDKFNNYLKKCDIPEEHFANGLGKFIYDEDRQYYIMWIPYLSNSQILVTLVHELHHYACCVFETIGIPISYENDEAMAYYKEMMMHKIIKKIKPLDK